MLIDVNASFGGRETIQHFRLETMLEQLNRIPCRVAFVSSNHGAIDPGFANDHVLSLCQRPENAWLRPVCAIHPRDLVLWRGEVDRCLAAGVRLFRLYPTQGAWPVDSVFMEQIVNRLKGTGAVLMIDALTPGHPSKVAALTAEAAIPVIFTDARYFPLSELLPVAEKYPHVFIETSRLTSPEAVELCVKTIGADRIVFGSGAARYPAWVAWQVLERADISAEDREAIAWKNAARLLEVDPVAVSRDLPLPISWQTERGPIIDIHLHDRVPGAPMTTFSPEAYEAELERRGIVHGVSSSYTGITYDLKQGNDEQAEFIRRVPRLSGYVVVNPRYHDESLRELRRLETDPRFVGVKVYCPTANLATNAPAVRRLFAAIADYGKPTLIHPLGEDWPEALVEIALEHPHLPIIAAHTGYGDAPHPTHDAAIRIAAAPNIFLEFCSTYLTVGAIRRGIEAAGIDRILYGSDFPLISEAYMLTAYDEAELTPDEARAIFSRNALRLFPAFATEDRSPD